MKRLMALLLSLTMLVLPFAGCADNQSDDVSSNGSETSGESSTDEKTVVRIAGMKGPTSIGLVNVIEKDSNNETQNDYQFTLAGAADEITPLLLKGELDIAAVPANLASVLYNKTSGEIQLLAVNTLGVLYMVAKGEEIGSVADLKGKTIYATGKGTTPEYTLRYILSSNGIDPDNDVTIDFKSEATEVVASITNAESAVAMLPQPYATIAMGKVEGLKTVLDLNEEWGKISPDGGIVTGVVVVRKSFAEQNAEAIKSFLQDYESSVATVNEDAVKAAELVVKHGIFENQTVIEKAIPKCNITFIAGEAMKAPVKTYLGVLYEQNNKSVGGALPEDDFFYIAK